MATEYRLSYTASEIDNRLGMAGNALLCVPQPLTEEQKAQVRENIGIDIFKDVYYYTNLSTAINDINNDVTNNALSNAENACIKVFIAENGVLTICLLEDVSESSAITVSKDINIMLAGHTINLINAKAHLVFAEGTTCTINGEVAGSAIVKGKIDENGNATISSGKTANDRICFIEAKGDNLTIQGGTYNLAVYAGHVVHAIRTNATSKQLNMFDCSVSAENTVALSDAISYQASTSCISVNSGKFLANGVSLYSKTRATNSVCIIVATGAEASLNDCFVNSVTTEVVPKNTAQGIGVYGGLARIENCTIDTDASGGNSDVSSSYGIKTTMPSEDAIPTVYLAKSKVYATFAGIGNIGNLYVRDCLLSGFSHGGFYTSHDENCKVYLKDSEFWSGFYDGQFGELVTGRPGSSNCYIGLSDDESGSETSAGGTVYTDGCVFGHEDAGAGAFCVRDSSHGTTPNRLFISNSEFVGHTTFRVQSRGNQIKGELYIGRGCNFSADNIIPDHNGVDTPDNNGIVEENSELYRKHYVGEVLTAEDFAVLIDAYPNGDEVNY